MAQNFPLKPLLQIAETQTGTAAAQLGVLNRQLREQEEKMRMLSGFRADYQERLRRKTSAGLDGAGLRNFHEFLERLERAIAQQQAAVADARARAAAGLHDWQLKQRKFKAFDKLSQRFDLVTQRRDATREQKLQDVFASRANPGKARARG